MDSGDVWARHLAEARVISNLPGGLQRPVARALGRLGVCVEDFDRALALAVADESIEDIAQRRERLHARLDRLERLHARLDRLEGAASNSARDRRLARAALKLRILHIDDAADQALDRALIRFSSDLSSNGAPGG